MTQQDKPKEVEEKETIKVDFSLPQILGGALAAATAAVIGSQLGVAGTILGAMVASIVGGIAGTLYSAGIDRTHRKVSEAITRGYDQVRSHPDYDPDGASPALPGLGDTQQLDAVGGSGVDPEPVAPDDGRRRKIWKVMGLSVAAMFLLALVAITIVELGLGRALDGKQGTTVSQVVRADPTPTPTPTATPTRTPSASITPSVTPTPSATDVPTTPAPTATVPTATSVPSATEPATPAAPAASTTP